MFCSKVEVPNRSIAYHLNAPKGCRAPTRWYRSWKFSVFRSRSQYAPISFKNIFWSCKRSPTCFLSPSNTYYLSNYLAYEDCWYLRCDRECSSEVLRPGNVSMCPHMQRRTRWKDPTCDNPYLPTLFLNWSEGIYRSVEMNIVLTETHLHNRYEVELLEFGQNGATSSEHWLIDRTE